jgi:hypothetical protein
VQCRACAHYRPAKPGACDAFRDRIPVEIISYGADHRGPVEGDGGVRFEQLDTDEARQAFADWQLVFGG